MKFNNLLKNIILENSRFEILFDNLTKPTTNKEGKKQKPKLSEKEFIQLVMADPTTKAQGVDPDNIKKEDFSKIKAGKFVNWLIKNFLTPNTETQPGDAGYDREVKVLKDRFFEDLYKVTDDLKKFERFKSRIPEDKRDINKLTPDELYELTKDFDLTMATTTKAERKKADVYPGSELVFDGPNWRVIKISDTGALGKEAACHYGGQQQETRWCTSAPGLSYFDTYIKQGPLYVVYNPNDPDVQPTTGLPRERYQFHFESDQFMDKDDRRIDLVDFLNGKMKELKGFFKPYFAKGLTSGGGSRLSIDSFKSGNVGKFVGLYGLEELFENLPENLQEIQINNKDTSVMIQIPESISRFQRLETLLLENCISELPESVCSLKELKFLSLMRNPNLRTIPSCIVDMPSLEFLNVRGSDNLELPQELASKSDEYEVMPGMWNLKEL